MASGPSLTPEIARKVRFARWLEHWRVVCVSDAYRLLPHGDVLYSCDWRWWRVHEGAKSFHGERWTCHSTDPSLIDDKSMVANEYPVCLVQAASGKGFSGDLQRIHYGDPGHSGFQAVNLALLRGASPVVLVGFDCHATGKAHFFGNHPEPLRNCDDNGYRHMAKAYPKDERILNATVGSAIDVYPFVDLDETVRRYSRHYRDRPEPQASADRDCAA
jgi:hypothetical protein